MLSTIMARIENKSSTSKEVQERCDEWVESQKELLYSKDNVLKRKLENENDEDFDTDSEFDSVSECGAKKRRKARQLKEEVFNLLCEWKNCLFDSNSIEIYIKHVANHIPQLEIRTMEENKEVYVCQWKSCLYESDGANEISRHVNFHGYHTKLKCIGSNIRGRTKLPKCYREKIVIDLPSTHTCQWEECLKIFNNYQRYLYHVITHIESNPRGNKVEGGVQCKWTNCNGTFRNLYKLKDHTKRHTKEKIVACPDCGAMFASNTKFLDHCRRQISEDVQGFLCTHCNKYYATENILREHMRFHIFNYKCNLCDMTCESPASLAKHIRYRHVSTRQFPCQLCSHAAKSQQDLDSHVTVHTTGPNFACSYEGCLYTCKGAYILDRHVERVHQQRVRWYCCHECPIRYRKSYRLTKHLIDAHYIELPNGHKRFRYTQYQEGCYRFQTVRYESIEEENDLPTENVMHNKISGKRYYLKFRETKPFPEVEVLEDTEETSSNDLEPKEQLRDVGKSMPLISNILISIDEMDEDGNIIQSKIVETQETNELPPSDGLPIILT